MPSASDLKAGEIKIQSHEGKSMFDLVFSERVLKIPPLRILDSTDALLRNLVAFEQCFHGCEQYVTSYALLMNQLIYTTRDVELLEQSGVVENYMGSREDVTDLFQNICKQIGLHEFHFSVLCNEVNSSYNRLWIQYKLAMKRDYLTSPWTLVSVLAVTFIVAMTMLQTLYTVLSYHSSHK
ncbi:UPF0481 protein At3g47200 [Linum perenne]